MKTPPSNSTIAQRIKRGWTEEAARSTPTLAIGRQQKQHRRAVVSERHRKGKKGESITFFEATIRGPGERIYLRSYPTRAEAETACTLFIETGDKPERAKTGPRPGCATGPRKRRQTQPQTAKREAAPNNSRSIDRMEVMRRLYREKFAN